MLGLSVFALVWVRVAARFFGGTPAIYPEPVAWQILTAKIVHGLLYVWMISLPLLGWLSLSAAGKPIPFFGFELPAIIGENKDLAKPLKKFMKLSAQLDITTLVCML